MDTLDKECIKVTKVYDWVTRPVHIELVEYFKEFKSHIKEDICGNIDILANDVEQIWKADQHLLISGRVTIFNESNSNCDLDVYINGILSFVVEIGTTKTFEFPHLQSVKLRRKQEGKNCFGTYCITLMYELESENFDSIDYEFSCFLSDKDGNPINSLLCKEIISPCGNRANAPILSKEHETMLREVKFSIKGYFTVVLVKGKKVVCRLYTSQLELIEKFFLCIPPETVIECSIFDLTCEANITVDCKSIVIDISFCQSIHVLGEVLLELIGTLCKPRRLNANDNMNIPLIC